MEKTHPHSFGVLLCFLICSLGHARRLQQQSVVALHCAHSGAELVSEVLDFLQQAGSSDVYINLESNVTLEGQGSYERSVSASSPVAGSLTIAGHSPDETVFDTGMRTGLLPVFKVAMHCS